MSEAADPTRAFVADVVHDLQSPLTGMRTQLEVALAHARTPATETWIRQMLAATAEMELLVGNLLSLAEEERLGLPPPRELVDLGTLIHQEAALPRVTGDVAIDLGRVEPLKVRGDETSLRRLVRNLLDNAVQHASAEVRISLSQARDTVVLDVVDDGDGVDEAHRGRIFDRFYRADPQHREGTGLGLSIVRTVAERHRGSADMLPGVPGEGAHFRVELPIPD